MPDTFSSRRLVELSHKFCGLEEEFASWRQRSELGGMFEKHNSQVRRAQAQLEPLMANIRAKLRTGRDAGAILADARPIEETILAVYRIWDFFRAKLSQRHEERFAPFLAVADEFAWACYEPARALAYPDAASGERREPPLVFFNGGWSPFAVPRDRAYRGEDVPGEPLSGRALREVLRSLPIPVVGLPWYQRQHLPDALVLGHEVGHLVEEDFGLTNVVQQAAQAADPARRAAWQRWAGEVFADVYGCLAAGPAFVATLMDVLAHDPVHIAAQTRSSPTWEDYPTDALRVLVNLEVLRQIGFAMESDHLARGWRTTYPSHSMTAFEADVPRVVEALLTGPYPSLRGTSLRDVLDFTPEMYEEAESTVGQVGEGSDISSRAIRPLFAAARLLYDARPQTFRVEGRVLLGHVLESLRPGTRGGQDELTEEGQASQEVADLARGEGLRQRVLCQLEFD